MIDWIKRAVRWPWFGRKSAARTYVTTGTPTTGRMDLTDADIAHIRETLSRGPQNTAYLTAITEATIAQKNVRLASTARTRDAIKDKIADAVKAKKKRSHLQAELARLTRMELEIEGNRQARMAIGGEG